MVRLQYHKTTKFTTKKKNVIVMMVIFSNDTQ